MRMSMQVQADLAVITLLQLLLCMCTCTASTAASNGSHVQEATIGSAVGECSQTKSSQRGHYHDIHGQHGQQETQEMTHEPASLLKSANQREAGQLVSHNSHHGIHKVPDAPETVSNRAYVSVPSCCSIAAACAAPAAESSESAELAEPQSMVADVDPACVWQHNLYLSLGTMTCALTARRHQEH